MDCNVTSFERVLHYVKEIPDDKKAEAYDIIIEEGLTELLDFCEEIECCTKYQSSTIYDFIIMWENVEDNYYEEDFDKLHKFYKAIGMENYEPEEV